MNTNFQTIHQMGNAVSEMVRQATGRNPVQSMEMDWVSVEQLAKYIYGVETGSEAVFDTNLEDGIMKLIAYINYIQNLNGYDYPWPAGGSTNLLPVTLSGLKTLNTTGTWEENAYTISGIVMTVYTVDGEGIEKINFSGTNSGESTLIIPLTQFAFESGTDNYILSGLDDGSASTYRYNVAGVGNYTDGDNTISGDGETHGVRVQIMSSAEVDFDVYPMIRPAEITEDDYYPYSNVCAIDGTQEVVINHLDGDIIANLEAELTWENATTNNSGETVPNNTYITSDFFPAEAGKDYFLQFNKKTTNNYRGILNFYDINDELVSGGRITVIPASQGSGIVNGHVKAPAGTRTMRITIPNSTYADNILLTYYKSYTADLTDIGEGYKLYQGSVDFISGKVLSDYAMWDGDTESLSSAGHEDDVAYYVLRFPDKKLGEDNVISNYLHTGGLDSWSIQGDSLTAEIVVIGLPYSLFPTVEDVASYLETHPLEILYELDEPETEEIDPTEVTAFIGQNIIFSDSGRVSVEYKFKEDVP